MPPFATAELEPVGSRFGNVEPPASATWVLPPAAISAQAARRQVSDQLQAWGLQHLTDDAELIVSELVTNAVCHGPDGDPVWHTVRRIRTEAGEMVRLEVGDGGNGGREGGGVPVQRGSGTPNAIEEDLPCNGRGLFLVEALSSDWGMWRLPHGHVVWAALPTWPESAPDMQ